MPNVVFISRTLLTLVILISVDGTWSTWTSWSSCTSVFGGGIQERNRSCTDPPPRAVGGNDCPGNNTETKQCHIGNHTPASTSRCPNVGLMMGCHRRRQAIFNPPLGQSLVIAGTELTSIVNIADLSFLFSYSSCLFYGVLNRK